MAEVDQMKVETTEVYSRELCEANPDKLYVFGGNLAGYGTGPKSGQAVIRGCSNAFEVPTKRYPSMAAGSFFTDRRCERDHVLTALRELYKLGKHYIIVFPKGGLGTGRAKMKEHSPLLFGEMSEIMMKHFGLSNG